MNTAPHSWQAKAAHALRNLAEKPWTLFALLLALNACARPYAAFYQDARIYSGQVLNQTEGGAYADDLFFRYGSQDQFSVFSRLVAPVVSCLGIEAAFLILYLLCNGFFLWALSRFVFALVEDRALAVLALAFLVVAPLPFSGHHVFCVHEAFLTPRLMANAVVLLAMERLLHQRFGTALALLGGALLLHPLQAFGGLLVWGGYLSFTLLRPRFVAALLALGAGLALAVLLYEPLGIRVFGRMDPEWRDIVLAASGYNFPLEWHKADWLNLSVSFAILLTAAGWMYPADARRRRFALVLVLAGLVGLLGTLLGSLLPYALLFQGQPYRVLWLLKAAQVPVGFTLIARLSRAPGTLPQLAGLGLLGFFSLTTFIDAELILPLLFLPFFALIYRGLGEAPRYEDWLWRTGIATIGAGALAWTVFKWLILAAFWDKLAPHLDALEYVHKPIDQFGVVAWLLVFVTVLVWLDRRGWPERPLRWGCVGFALAYHSFCWAIPSVDALRARFTRQGPDVLFVRDYLAQRWAGHADRPTVYCSLGRIDYLWVDLRSKSYYDGGQVSGVLFNRRTALEAQRRVMLVRPFEVGRYRGEEILLPEETKLAMRRLFKADFDCPSPSLDDLRRLCQEPGLDYVIVKEDFAGLAVAHHGELYVYDCRQVRAALHLPEPDSAGALAAR